MSGTATLTFNRRELLTLLDGLAEARKEIQRRKGWRPSEKAMALVDVNEVQLKVHKAYLDVAVPAAAEKEVAP